MLLKFCQNTPNFHLKIMYGDFEVRVHVCIPTSFLLSLYYVILCSRTAMSERLTGVSISLTSSIQIQVQGLSPRYVDINFVWLQILAYILFASDLDTQFGPKFGHKCHLTTNFDIKLV
jgi:hypothetical protein